MEEMTAQQVAEFLKVARTTIYSLVENHGFPRPFKIGGSVRWYRDEVLAWRASRDAAR